MAKQIIITLLFNVMSRSCALSTVLYECMVVMMKP